MLLRPLRWLLRKWYLLLGALLALLLLVAFLFPYLLKRYIEDHSEAWINRKVSIGSIVLNPFTGEYAVNGLVCHEPASDTVFVRFSKLGVKADLLEGYRNGVWRLREAELREPYVRVVQTGNRFNFSDLLEIGATEEPEQQTTAEASAAFAVFGIALTGGRIDYTSDALPAPVSMADLNVTCTEISSGQAVMDFAVAFTMGGGRLDGGFTIDTKAGRYAVQARLKDFAVEQLRPYLAEFMDCGVLRGGLDLDLNVTDSYVDTTSLALSSAIALRDLELFNPGGDRLVSIKRLGIALDTLIAAQQRFDIGEVALAGADLHFALLNDGKDNWTRLLKLPVDSAGQVSTEAVSESNVFVMLADYIGYLGREFVASEYSAHRVRLDDCGIRFEDYTPRSPFRYVVSDIALSADRITTEQDTGRINVSALLNESGKLTCSAAFAPSEPGNMRVSLELAALRLTALDPYVRWYAAHPMEDGVLSFRTATTVHEGIIDSRNALRIDRLRFGHKVEDHDTGIYVLPLRLATALLKDVRGVINLEVPVRGDLKDPQFRIWPIVWQVLKNLVVKAVSAPGRLLVRAVGGTGTDDFEEIRFDHLQYAPDQRQSRVLQQLVRAMANRSELRVDLVALVDDKAEQQELALFAAKRKHLFGDRALTSADSTSIQTLHNGDSLFVRFVTLATPALEGKPLQERCTAMIGRDVLTREQAEIEYARRENIMQFMLLQGADPARTAFRTGTDEELGGRTGLPGYRFIFDAAEATTPSPP